MGAPTNEFSIHSSIPVLPIWSEAEARSFYVDFLGFEVEREHRFQEVPSSPLYLQIRFGDAVLHLNGHAERGAPVCEVRFPVAGLGAYQGFLRGRSQTHAMPEMIDVRHEGRKSDMPIKDPFGNLLIFWTPEHLHDE